MPLLALGGVCLVAGLWGGLVRLGFYLPASTTTLAVDHGPLMVGGFLGTLIALERAVALERRWAYMAPLLTGVGFLTIILGAPLTVSAIGVVAGSVIFLLASMRVVSRQPAIFTLTMAAGALAWLAGNVQWGVGRPVFELVLWWFAFLLLTIAGERLELSRLQRPSRLAMLGFGAAGVVFAVGVVTASWWPGGGARIAGAGAVAFALWLGWYDIARRTIRLSGLARYVGASVLSGYAWLGLSGGLLLAFGSVVPGPRYDAVLHGFFVGFVFSMIFGHAPIILPAVLGIRVSYRPALYAPLVLLHASLVLRMAGDLGGWFEARLAGGALNAAAIVALAAIVGGAGSGASIEGKPSPLSGSAGNVMRSPLS